MHIASALTIVRREPVQSELSAPGGRGLAGVAPAAPILTSAASPRPRPRPGPHWREAMPGAIVLAVLALLGALFPVLF